MIHPFTILVCDRNPRIRQFLKRELESEGYEVMMAKDGREVLSALVPPTSPDLVILDLDLPHVGGLEILDRMKAENFKKPVMVYSCHTEYANHPVVRSRAYFFEKTGDDIDTILVAVSNILREVYPGRFRHMHNATQQLNREKGDSSIQLP